MDTNKYTDCASEAMAVGRRRKTTVGIWLFGPGATRYQPAGLHPELRGETMVQRTARVAEGLDGLIDGFEYHYPGEINEENQDALRSVLGPQMDIYSISSELPKRPQYRLGALTNPDPGVRAEALAESRRAIDLCAAVGASFNYWSGGEGYDYPFQLPYTQAWLLEVEGVSEIVAYAAALGVPVTFETKAYGPAQNILLRNIGTAMWLIQKVGALGVDISRCGVNLDWQHLHMTGESLAESASLLASQGMLSHMHANAGWGIADEANLPGTTYFMRTLELAVTLQDLGYGQRGERIGYDCGPGIHDGVAALRQAILHWEFIDLLAARVDRQALRNAQAGRNAVAAYREVYRALGLDDDVEKMLLRS